MRSRIDGRTVTRARSVVASLPETTPRSADATPWGTVTVADPPDMVKSAWPTPQSILTLVSLPAHVESRETASVSGWPETSYGTSMLAARPLAVRVITRTPPC